MAGMQLQPMQTFDFLQPAQWPMWKQRFEQFRVASGLIDRSEGRQISTLLYSMGPEAQDVLETTGIDEENRGVYDSVIASFDEYFGVRRNIIFERAQFNSRKQQPGESAEQYILALYTLAGRCGYASREQKEQDIRDRLVIGIRDAQLSKRLQLTADLDLTKAKKMILQTEAVQETQKLSAGDILLRWMHFRGRGADVAIADDQIFAAVLNQLIISRMSGARGADENHTGERSVQHEMLLVTAVGKEVISSLSVAPRIFPM